MRLSNRIPAFVAFFLSGASSLIFQNIWGRMLHHVFGSTSVAISTVVTAFMAGLGLGAFVAGRYADRIRHPIITYAIAELGVGLWALLVPGMVNPEGWLATVNLWLRVELGSGSAGFMIGRFLFVLPILLVPTTLMGASLPLLARHFVQSEERAGVVGSRVGVLYAVNTFGAVVGVFAAGFVLMPAFGVTVTNLVAVSMNLLLAAGIYSLRGLLLGPTWSPGQRLGFLPEGGFAFRAAARPDAAAGEGPRGSDDGEPITPLVRKAVFFAFAASGAAALCYEVAWTRTMAMTIGGSIYSFALILCTFLVGIAGGSAAGSAVLAKRSVMLGVVAALSVALSTMAAAMWAVEDGFLTYLAVTAVAASVIVAIGFAARTRTAVFEGEDPIGSTPLLLMILVPVALSLLGVVLYEGELPKIVLVVTALVGLFFALLAVLRGYPVMLLALVQLYIAGASFANYVFQDEIPCSFARLLVGVTDLPDHVGLVQFLMFFTTALSTLPATLGMGAMFPITLRVWTAGRGVGVAVGTVYAGNTVGSIVGAWLPGFVLMPLLGVQRTIQAGILLNLLLGLFVLLSTTVGASGEPADKAPEDGDEEGRPRMPVWYAATIYVLAPVLPALVVLLAVFGSERYDALRWDLARMTLGVFRVSLADNACSPEWGAPHIVYYKDGLSTTVSVERWGRHYVLKNNGKVDASNGGDMPTQVMVAGFPLLLHPSGPEDLDLAIIGFGSGVTVGAALEFPIKHIDVVELERSTVEASRSFADVNHLEYTLDEFPYVRAPRLTIINDDGRNYLASTKKKYDLIISEPSNPWLTGVSDLFTTDHFRITKRRLKKGGVYAQWVQLYEMSPEHVKTIYRTFASQFDHVLVFVAEDGSSDTILLGSDAPLELDQSRVAPLFEDARIADELERAYVHTPFDVFARLLIGNRDDVMKYTQIEYRRKGGEWEALPMASNDLPCEKDCRREPAPLNTDDEPLIEFGAPKDLIGYERYEDYPYVIHSDEWPYARASEHVVHMGTGEDAASRYASLALSLLAHGRKLEAAAAVEAAARAGGSRETLVAAEVVRLLSGDGQEPSLVVDPPTPGPALASRERRALEDGFTAVKAAIDKRDWEAAFAAVKTVPEPLLRHSGPATRMLYAYVLYKAAVTTDSSFSDVITELEDLIRSEEHYARRHPEVYFFLARAHDERRFYDKALRNMRMYVESQIGEAVGAGDGSPGAAPTTNAEGESDKGDKSAASS